MLSKLNPLSKLLANLVFLTVCVFVFDPYTPALLLALAVLTGIVTGSLQRQHLGAFVPFFCFAFGMFMMNAAWSSVPGASPVAHLGPLVLTDAGIRVGLSLAARVLAIAASSLLFVATTEPTDLMLSLMQHWRLSPGLAYSVLAAFRFMPTMQSELAIIQAAHRIRGRGANGWRSNLTRGYRYAIPLLAGGIRRAERVALAMEARGFETANPRTFYRQISWRQQDSLYLIGTIAVITLTLFFSQSQGWLVLFAKWKGF